MRQGLSASESGKLGAIAAESIIRANKQKRIISWNANPKLCKFCLKPISYENRRNNFCDHSCAASFNNKGIRRHGEAPKNCLHCSISTYNKKYCSAKCQIEFEWQLKKEEIKIGSNENVAVETLKKYCLEVYGNKCIICQLSEWLNNPLPLVMDHIDGNPYNNTVSNLRLICNNCDALLPTFKGRNKGNGRFKRAERYKFEKEILK